MPNYGRRLKSLTSHIAFVDLVSLTSASYMKLYISWPWFVSNPSSHVEFETYMHRKTMKLYLVKGKAH